jgi:ATP-dependent DNA ligase
MANDFYASFVANGYEGMMYRLGDCPYTVPKQESYPEGMLRNSKLCSRFLSDKDNRAWHLLKRKDWQDDEFLCLGVEEGEGKLKGTLGSLTCTTAPTDAHYDRVFSVGSGLTDSQRDFYWRNPPIGKLIKVKYLCLSSDGIPLNPTIHPDHIIS